ncbi:MAG: protein-tyrosine phosphatase family protein [Janthinobacterium lividum]
MTADCTWLTPMLAIGGAVPPAGLRDFVRAEHIRAIVDLRAEDCDDAAALGREGVAFLHLPTPDCFPPDLTLIDRGVAFAAPRLAAGTPVLVHCEHGIGRAPLMALCILIAAGLAPLDALMLAKDRRPVVSPSPAQYEGWAAWIAARHPGVAVPDFTAFATVAYRHLAMSA